MRVRFSDGINNHCHPRKLRRQPATSPLTRNTPKMSTRSNAEKEVRSNRPKPQGKRQTKQQKNSAGERSKPTFTASSQSLTGALAPVFPIPASLFLPIEPFFCDTERTLSIKPDLRRMTKEDLGSNAPIDLLLR
ncbi:hypothetical protein NDU88_003805 [Pleurodeles waltl]|uniref:Uncharacterized protein n=1 Tax=Pleurodeles waltl TaxID=8319 RepID=A0AAV7WQ45_PLEWA|nr:hypothetical protein NDU88_003805 [Pleurodeles waltl]